MTGEPGTRRYVDLGVSLTGSQRQDYGPDLAVTIELHRCARCGATVDVGRDSWSQDGRDLHTEWHARTDLHATTDTPEETP